MITVCSNGCDFGNITGAMGFAKAGDTVEVHSGIYNESIDVTKSINLIGMDTGMARPLIIVSFPNSFSLSADNIRLSGFDVNGDNSSLIAIYSNNNTLSFNKIDHFQKGIILGLASGNYIENNSITNCSIYGIGVEESHNNTIKFNNLSNNSYGISLLSSDNNTIERNDISNSSKYGVVIEFSKDNNIFDNIFIKTQAGIAYDPQYQNKIHNNSIIDSVNKAEIIVSGTIIRPLRLISFTSNNRFPRPISFGHGFGHIGRGFGHSP